MCLRFALCLVRGAAELGKPASTDPYMEDLGTALDGLDAALVSQRARAKRCHRTVGAACARKSSCVVCPIALPACELSTFDIYVSMNV